MKINGNPDGGGGKSAVIESLSVTSNGTYTADAGVDGYSPVEVSVPEQKPEETFNVTPSTTEQTITPQEGYVFTSGVVGAVTSNIDANIQAGNIKSGVSILGVEGNYTAPAPVTESLSVSVNGTYTPGQGVDGFSQVVVDVPQSVTGYTEKEITEETYAIYNLNNSASFVHRNVFEGDYNLLTVTLPNASYVGSEAFRMCSNLTSVDMATCENVYQYAFTDCSSLTQISMPELKYASMSAFAFCRNLEMADFPKLSSIGSSIFNTCTNMSEASLPEIVTLTQTTFGECSNLTTVYIPKCTRLENNVFYKCFKLQDVDMTMFISVGNNTFGYCSMLSQAILTNCMSIGNGVFAGCSSLELLSFGYNYMRFSYSNTLTSTKIASGLGSIYVPDYNYSWYITANGWSSLSARFVSYETSGSPLNYSDGLVYGTTSFLDYYFTSALGISYIDVTGIDLPECSILYERPGYGNTYALKECKNLQTLTIGLSSVNTAILGLSSLKKLQTVNIPSCTYIDNQAFMSLYSLTQISASLCKYLGQRVFLGCRSLLSIDLPVCSIVNQQAFNGCSMLSQVNIPLCESIGWNAFAGCSLVQSIDLPVCSYIGAAAFENCISLSNITLRSNIVCEITTTTFINNPITSGTGSIYVPASLVDAYKSANNWSVYSSQIFPIE